MVTIAHPKLRSIVCSAPPQEIALPLEHLSQSNVQSVHLFQDHVRWLFISLRHSMRSYSKCTSSRTTCGSYTSATSTQCKSSTQCIAPPQKLRAMVTHSVTSTYSPYCGTPLFTNNTCASVRKTPSALCTVLFTLRVFFASVIIRLTVNVRVFTLIFCSIF